jgi:sigma-B regulation protein RsbU (phosphoserine phosphatase)
LREKYVTLVYGVFDKANMSFTYSNAGHSTPFLYCSQFRTPKELETGGLPVGMLEDSKYEQEELSLQPRNLLLMYTDGLTEATNKMDEQNFGEQRIHRIVKKNAHKSAQTVINKLAHNVKDFCGGTLQDDITFVALKVKETE